jgi:hypothetical protein
MEPNDAARIIFGDRPTEGLNRNSNNGSPIPATFLPDGRCLAHLNPPQRLATPTRTNRTSCH